MSSSRSLVQTGYVAGPIEKPMDIIPFVPAKKPPFGFLKPKPEMMRAPGKFQVTQNPKRDAGLKFRDMMEKEATDFLSQESSHQDSGESLML